MSDFDFGHIMADAKVKTDKARPYEFIDLKGAPKFFCLPATNENSAYRDSRVTRINRRRKDLKRGLNITVQLLDKSEAEDKELFARHCVTGWEGVKGKDNKPVPFSFEACKKFLDQLPDYVFEDFREWIQNPSNFLDADQEDDADGETLGN